MSGISSATFGDGDAGQNSNGKERKTDVNEWVIGFKDGTNKDELTTYDLSIGRQNIMIGDGFFIAGDALNLGKVPADGTLDQAAHIIWQPVEALILQVCFSTNRKRIPR